MTRKPLMIGAAVMVALAVAWYALLWSPATSRLHAAQAAKVSALASAASVSSEIAGLEVSARKLPAERAAAAAVARELPTTADIPGFIDQLTSVAGSTGVELTSLSQSVSAATSGTSGTATPATPATTKISGLGVLNVQFAVGGTYAQTMAFISAVEGLPRFVSIATLGVSGTTGALTTNLTASAYFDTTTLPKVPTIPTS